MAPMIKMDGHVIISNIFYVMVAYHKEYFQPRLTKNVPVANFLEKWYYVATCTFYSSFEVKCPVRRAKKSF